MPASWVAPQHYRPDALGPLVAQCQALLPLKAMDTLVVALEKLAPQHHVHTHVAVVPACLGDLFHAHDQRCIAACA